MSAKRATPGSAGRFPWGFALGMSLFVIAALLLAVSAAMYSRWLMMAPQAASAPQSDSPSVAAAKEMVIEVVNLRAQDQLKARLLQPSGAAYLRTADFVWIKLDPATPVAMGSRRDIRTGAILDVTAVPRPAPDQWGALGLTVLTGYVRVSGGS